MEEGNPRIQVRWGNEELTVLYQPGMSPELARKIMMTVVREATEEGELPPPGPRRDYRCVYEGDEGGCVVVFLGYNALLGALEPPLEP